MILGVYKGCLAGYSPHALHTMHQNAMIYLVNAILDPSSHGSDGHQKWRFAEEKSDCCYIHVKHKTNIRLHILSG